MPPAAKKHPRPKVPYVAMTMTATTTASVNGKTYKKELTVTQSAGPRGPVQGTYSEKNPGQKKTVVNLKKSNLGTYLKRF